MPEVDRLASRLLVLAPSGRVLLLRLEPSFRAPFWVTPGGGLDDGETYEDCARRELHEEVGRDDLALGPCVTEQDVEFTWEEWHVRQHERTFLVRAEDEFEAVVLHADEEPIVGSGWFGEGELRALTDDVYPDGLPDVVHTVLESAAPDP